MTTHRSAKPTSETLRPTGARQSRAYGKQMPISARSSGMRVRAEADSRELTADARQADADARDVSADARGAEADSRELTADARQADADARDSAPTRGRRSRFTSYSRRSSGRRRRA